MNTDNVNNINNDDNSRENNFDIDLFIYFINSFRFPGQELDESVESTYIDPIIFSIELPLESTSNIMLQKNLNDIELLTVDEQVDCEICFKNKQYKTNLACEHSFCKDCITEWVKRLKNSCPMCRTPISH